jgi:hypothetical protein
MFKEELMKFYSYNLLMKYEENKKIFHQIWRFYFKTYNSGTRYFYFLLIMQQTSLVYTIWRN